MKKFLLSLSCIALAYADYAASNAPLMHGSKQIGEIIIGTQFDKVGKDIIITGYRPAGGKIIYDTLGVLSTSVILKDPKAVKVLGTKVDDYDNTWQQVQLKAQLSADKMSTKDPILAGQALFKERCGTCHALHSYDEFSKNVWPSTIKSMQDNAGLDDNEYYQVVKFLQRVAPDDE